MSDTQPVWTASLIARALGRSKRSVLMVMQDIPAAVVRVAGNDAKAWPLYALPAGLQRELESAASLGGYRNAEHLLSASAPASATARKRRRSLRQTSIDAPDFSDLERVIIRHRTPKPGEVDKLWLEIARWCRDQEAAGIRTRASIGALIDFLCDNAPYLSPSREGIRVSMYRYFKRCKAKNFDAKAVIDGRELKRGEKRLVLPQADIDIVQAHAVFRTGGRLTQACEELLQMGAASGLTPGTRAHLAADPDVKTSLRKQLTPGIAETRVHTLSKRQKDNHSAALELDWSTIPSRRYFTCDDFTLPVRFRVPDGKGWWTTARGQCLLAADGRANCILGHAFRPEPTYTALMIWSLMRRVYQQHGIFPIAWLEHGLFERSKLLRGDKAGRSFEVPQGTPHSWIECEFGLELAGVTFIHANTARGKPGIERIGGLLQNLMEYEPGYCGREEKEDLPEETRRWMLRLTARDEKALEYFNTFEQWADRLQQLIDQYNNRRQRHSDKLNSLTPLEGFEEFKDHTDPPIEFDASCMIRLSHHAGTRLVRKDGIRVGGFWYRDGQTGSLPRGEMVRFYWDPENPESIALTRLNGTKPIIVPMHRPVTPGDTDSDEFAEEMAKAKAHDAHWKTRYHVLKAVRNDRRRINAVDPRTAELNRFVTEGQAKLREEQEAGVSRARSARQAASKLGLETALVGSEVTDDQRRGLERLKRAARGAGEETTQ